jgi:hypothetical protein
MIWPKTGHFGHFHQEKQQKSRFFHGLNGRMVGLLQGLGSSDLL